MSSVARVIKFLREKGFSPQIRHYDDVIDIMMTSSKDFSCQQVYLIMVFHRGKFRLSSTSQSKVIGRGHFMPPPGATPAKKARF